MKHLGYLIWLMVAVLVGGATVLAGITISTGEPPTEFQVLLEQLVFYEMLTEPEALLDSFALYVAGVFALLAAAKFLFRSGPNYQLPALTNGSPEEVSDSGVNYIGDKAAAEYHRLQAHFLPPSRTHRQIAAYGRTPFSTDKRISESLDELAELAGQVYATKHNCEQSTARKAIETGTWSENRIATTFLATTPKTSFTPMERLTAWLFPKRVFERRLVAVVDEIERQADSYLTYTTTAELNERRTQTDVDQNAGKEGGTYV